MRDGVVFIQSEEEKRRYLKQYHPKCTLYTYSDNELSHPTNVKFRRDDFFIPRNNNEEGEKQYLSQFFNENCSNILFTSINNVIFKYEYYKEFFFIEADYLNDGLVMHFLPKYINCMDNIIIQNDQDIMHNIPPEIFYGESQNTDITLKHHINNKELTLEEQNICVNAILNYDYSSEILTSDEILYAQSLINYESLESFNINDVLDDDVFVKIIEKLVLSIYDTSETGLSEYIIPINESLKYSNNIEIHAIYQYPSNVDSIDHVLGVLDKTNKDNWNKTTLMERTIDDNRFIQNNKVDNYEYSIDNTILQAKIPKYHVDKEPNVDYIITNKYINDALYSEDYKKSYFEDVLSNEQYAFREWVDEDMIDDFEQITQTNSEVE